MNNHVPQRWRKRPVEIEAMLWDGTPDCAAAITEWSGKAFNQLDPEDAANSDDPDATAAVYDRLHSTWVLTYTGDYVIRGVQGEHYPCRPDVFAATYEQAEAAR